MPASATFIGRELPICQYTAINTAYTEVELPTAYAYLRTGGNQPGMVARLISAPHVAVLSGSAPVAAAIDRSCDGDRPHLRWDRAASRRRRRWRHNLAGRGRPALLDEALLHFTRPTGPGYRAQNLGKVCFTSLMQKSRIHISSHT
jgi:hypothetical protein